MDVVGAEEAHGLQVDALDKCQLLQEDRTLAPGCGLVHGGVLVGEMGGGLIARPPTGKIGSGQQSRVPLARAVDRGNSTGGIDGFGHKTFVEGPASGLDLAVTVRFGGFSLLQDSLVGAAKVRIAKCRSGLRNTISKVDARRLRPLAREEWRHVSDRLGDRWNHRIARRRVFDRVLEDVAQAHRAVLAEQHQPRTEGPRNAGRQQAGPRNVVQPELLKVTDAGRLRRRPLPADDLDLGVAGVPEDDRQITARAVEVGLDDLKDKPGGHRRVERIAASLQDRHAGL